ncbi:hypothetical protein ACIO6T_37915 [Streptomyces sp. NPDC087532]|uniref:hypothetical protein n=1 Tax=Streptomyces sp. NPDC087532 TaxID=3365795 RepID=UPI0038196D3A
MDTHHAPALGRASDSRHQLARRTMAGLTPDEHERLLKDSVPRGLSHIGTRDTADLTQRMQDLRREQDLPSPAFRSMPRPDSPAVIQERITAALDEIYRRPHVQHP